jgi:UDP-N-acetyl-D-glucosamine dehydrogenase
MTDMKSALLKKIEDRSAVAAVIGLGYVGLPLAMELCEAGFHVIGYDVSERVVGLLMRGESHIQDVPAEQVGKHVKSGKFLASTDAQVLRKSDTVSIAVPTPLAKTRDPDMSYVLSAASTIAEQAHPGMLIVLESTTYPGTTRELLQPRLEEKGLTVGKDVFLAFSPERVDPGNPTYHTKNTPKVVGGITPACNEIATAFYSSTIDTVVTVSSPEAAGLVKLLENTFRMVNIALVNELAMLCA